MKSRILNKWTQDELSILDTNQHLDINEIASLIPRHSNRTVRKKINQLGLGYISCLYKPKIRQYRGYNYILVEGKRIAEHWAVMEQFIGRKLKNPEQVHHINKMTTQNNIENLVLMRNSSEHHRSEASFNKCVAKLLKNNIITYDKSTHLYKLGKNF